MNYNISFNTDFRRNPYKGIYIALEGIDGSGKTVQEESIASYVRDKGEEVLAVSEPRRVGMIGRLINEVLQKRIKIPPTVIQYLFSADRISHQDEVILPALKRGMHIVSHRCFWSSIPYGIIDHSKGKYDYATGEVLLAAYSILSMYYQIVVPDYTFYLKVSAETAMSRLRKLGIKSEHYETLEKLKQVKKGYDWMVKKFPKEFVVIDGEKSPEGVTSAILAVIKNKI